jgi:hypothetical protein
MGPRLVLFAGAPEAASLKWDESELLTSFIAPIARFAGLEADAISLSPDGTGASFQPPAWRSLPLERRPFETGFTQSFAQDRDYTQVPQAQGWLGHSQGTSFFNISQVDSLREGESPLQATGSFASGQSVEQVLSQFYEESYARHADVASSQIAPASEASTSFTHSEPSLDSLDSFPNTSASIQDVPIVGHLSNLQDIPNATYLNSIQPQTMTVNLIIGVISIQSPRSIKTRRGAHVELVEVLVGDETKSGFGINFWLSSQSPSSENSMKSILESLRPQDVILVKNVALSSFQNKVYGQSLRKDMTKVYLLYRNRIDRSDTRGCYSAADLVSREQPSLQVEKTRRVREWVFKFVGLGIGGSRKRNTRASDIAPEVLPDDTQ